jgi:crotonobetainyl-CoA:carnitine CoA-transferase CaiB-like acyl-CoA transferase
MTTPSTTTKEHQMTTIQLTPAQHAILAYAIEHTGGKIEWFPDNIKGGARTKVLEGLFNKALITRDSTDWFVAAEGYDALGRARPTPATLHPDPEVEAAVSAQRPTGRKKNRTRPSACSRSASRASPAPARTASRPP